MPEIRHSLELPIGHGQLKLRARHAIGRELHAMHYDQAIILPNSLKSSLIPFWAGIPRRTGYRGELRFGLINDIRRLDKDRLPMTAQRFMALGLAANEPVPNNLPLPTLCIAPEAASVTLQKLAPSRGKRPVLAVCPGAAFGPAKQWPPEYFGAVVRTMIERGWTAWVLGAPADREVARKVCESAPDDCLNVAGHTTLLQTIDLLSFADMVISNDSGLMHIAAALNRPLVAVYGSSDPAFTPPLNPRAKIERLGLACSPCFQRQCPLGHTRCLTDLQPSRIISAIDALLAT
jgi:heptosyltransferase-2